MKLLYNLFKLNKHQRIISFLMSFTVKHLNINKSNADLSQLVKHANNYFQNFIENIFLSCNHVDCVEKYFFHT